MRFVISHKTVEISKLVSKYIFFSKYENKVSIPTGIDLVNENLVIVYRLVELKTIEIIKKRIKKTQLTEYVDIPQSNIIKLS